MIQPELLTQDKPLIWSPGKGTDVWEMFCAAGSGDLVTLRRLLDNDPSLIRATYEYRGPLSFAVRANQIEAASLLLARGANPVNSGTSDTLLTMARDRGHEEMENLLEVAITGRQGGLKRGGEVAAAIRERSLGKVQRLLDASPELLHARDETTNQPIHWAVMTRQLDVIDELVTRGADLHAQRADGARPIQLTNGDYSYRGWRDVPAALATDPRMVLAHLRVLGAECDLCTAAYIGDLDRVRELIAGDPALANRPSDYVSYYPCSGTPLRNAAGGGHLEIVRFLLENGADPNLPEEGIAPRGHALHAAVCGGHSRIVQLLLAHGAHPNVEIESSADTLSAAIARSDQPLIDLLCSHGAARRVHLLAYYGDLQTAAAVFAANPALAGDPEALENAAGEGHEAFVRLMLHYQPDLPRRIAVGAHSQGPQAATKTRALTELLFRHGMDPSRPNWLHVTPLHRFAQQDDVDNATIFIEHGADLEARDEELCSTPLGWAAKFGRIRMAELLLSHGAKTNLPDDPAWATPLAWATRRGHPEIVDLLRHHGARS